MVLLIDPSGMHKILKLRLILRLYNMLKFAPWGHSKSTYALMEGGGGTPKRCENVHGDEDLPRAYVCLYKAVFSHLYYLFLFSTSLMGKYKL